MKQKLLILLILVVSIYQKTFCQAPPCRYQTNDSKTVITDSAAGWIIYGYVQMIRTVNDYRMHLQFRNGIDQKSVTAYKIIKGQFFKLFLKNKDTVFACCEWNCNRSHFSRCAPERFCYFGWLYYFCRWYKKNHGITVHQHWNKLFIEWWHSRKCGFKASLVS